MHGSSIRLLQGKPLRSSRLFFLHIFAGAASRWLEAAVVGQSGKDQQQQQQQQNPAQAMLGVFDLSMLKYKERDQLMETFQQYRCVCTVNMPTHS
jgi:hypothetical protein